MTENNAAHDLGTSSGGRAYIAEYFATQLRRHDFTQYITTTLAADFACALARHLSKLRAEGVQAGDERISIRGAANLAFNALHECTPVKGAEKQYSDAIQALQSALHDIAYTVNRTATAQQFADHLQREARAALASAPVAGEAQPVCWIEKDVLESVRDEGSDAWVYWRPADHVAESDEMPLYAAPQASEAVPMHKLAVAALNDLLIDIRAELGLGTTEEEGSILDTIRALKTQADKDGGDCAKGTSDHENMREVLQWIVDDAASGGVAKLRPQQEKRARAALSPTQPTEQGERDE